MSDGSMAAMDTAAVMKNGPGQPVDGVNADLAGRLVEQARGGRAAADW